MFWNWRQRRMRLLLGAAVVACAMAVVRPPTAMAGYPLTAGAPVVLGFGATYRSAEATTSSTHRGVDLAASPGAEIVAPFEGRVTFVGRIPAVGGGSVNAVTLETARGTVTLLPLEVASVTKGQSVAEGSKIGSLADGGDGSSAGTHLHVGVKRGDLYVDPMSLLALPAAATGGEGATSEGASVAHGAGAATSAGAGANAGVAATRGLSVSSGVSVAPRLVAHPVRATTTLRVATPGDVIAPGVCIGGAAPRTLSLPAGVAAGPLAAAGLGPLPLPAAHATAAAASSAALADLVARLGRAAASSARMLVLAAIAALLGVALLWPVWRDESQKGTGEVRVSAFEDDVAAAVGQ